ncbi:DNA-binding transcriptional MocR family regulator [Mesorhizobium robiniae]|uniref:DNA-binding transcriptional MocR family regulator n=1 Tax=Mesorhizobium robiniae TaxID=559315 RepID=A0ABV2GNL1_9HYPH
MTEISEGRLSSRVRNLQPSAIRRMLAASSRPGMISFAGGLPAPELFDVSELQEAAGAVLSRNSHSALQYGATEGVIGLREELVQIMNRRGLRTDVDKIIVTTGAQQALELIGKVILDKGDVVLVERPTYTTAIQTFRLCGANVLGVDSDNDGLRTDALERKILELRYQGLRPRMIYVIPNFSNPAGWLTSIERRRLIAEVAVRQKVLVVEDDPYGDIYFGSPPAPPIYAFADKSKESAPWFCYLGSLSKIVAPGLRIGWAVLPSDLVQPITIAKQGSDLQGSTYTQYVAQYYLRSGRLPEHLLMIRKAYSERCKLLSEALRRNLGHRVEYLQPKGGLFVWVKLLNDINAEDVVEKAIAHGVVYVPGGPFYSDNPNLDTLRLTFATAQQGDIEEGTRRLAAVLCVEPRAS